jgi:hypothetical protein
MQLRMKALMKVAPAPGTLEIRDAPWASSARR